MRRYLRPAALSVFSIVAGAATADAQAITPTLPFAGAAERVVPVVPDLLTRTLYAAEMLPASPARPYVIVPRYGFADVADPNLRWGYRSSPYGDYGRFNYTSTGPFPGMPRPYVWSPHECRKSCAGTP
jgi:hypothetical protein